MFKISTKCIEIGITFFGEIEKIETLVSASIFLNIFLYSTVSPEMDTISQKNRYTMQLGE